MIAGTLEIQLMANMARLQEDMNQARRAVGGAMSSIEQSVAVAKGALIGLATVGTAMSFVSMIKGAIDAADNLRDLSNTTGIAIGDLAGLKLAAKQSGGDLEGISASINKLSVAMGKDAERFKLLGVTAKDPLEAFKQLSDVFSAIKDPQMRAALGAEALGKSWASAAPLMSEGGKKIGEMVAKGKELSGITEEMANMADEFNDTMEEMKAAIDGAKMSLAADMLPAMTSVTKAITAAYEESGKLSAAWTAMGALGAFLYTDEFDTAKTKLATLNDELRTLRDNQKHSDDVPVVSWLLWGSPEAWDADIAVKKAQIAKLIEDTKPKAKPDEPPVDPKAAADAAAFLKLNAEASAEKDKLASAYQNLSKSIREKLALSEIEAVGGIKATESQKETIKLEEMVASAKKKGLVLNTDFALSNIALLATNEKVIDSNTYYIEQARDKAAASGNLVKAAETEARKQEDLVKYFGMTKGAIEALEVTRLEELVTQNNSINYCDLETIALENLLDAKKRNAAASSQLDTLTAEKKALDDLAAETKKFNDDLYQGLSDSLMRGFEAGKRFFKTFWDSIRNLFKTTVLKLAVQGVMTSVLGAGVAGTASAAGGAPNAIQQGQSLWQGFSQAGSLASGAQTLFGNALVASGEALGIGSLSAAGYASSVAGLSSVGAGSQAAMLAAQTGEFGAAGLSATAAAGGGSTALGGLSTAIAAIPVWGWALLGAAAIAASFGGGKDRVTGAQNVAGTLGTNDINRSVDWTKDGGWFNANTSGTWNYNLASSTAVASNGQSYQDSANVGKDSAMLKALNETYAAMKTATTDYTKALGLNADSIKDRADKINFALTGDAEKDAKTLQAALLGVADTMANDVVPGLSAFMREGETSSATLARLAGGLTGANNVFEALGLAKFASTLDGAAAASKLIELSGGVEKFATSAAFYMENFRTEAEKNTAAAATVGGQMAALGYGSVTTVAGFKELVSGLDLTKSSQSSLYVELLKLAPAFKAVADAASTSANPVNSALQAFNAAQNNVKAALNNVAGALDALSQKAIATSRSELAVKDKISQAYFSAQDAVEAAQKKIADITRQSADSLLSFSGNIKAFLSGLKGVGGGDSYAALKSNLKTSAALAQGGDTAAQSGLTGLAQRFLDAAKNNSSSAAGYLQDEASVRSLLSGVANSVDDKVKALNLPAIVDPMTEANKELIDAQKKLLELTALAAATGASTDRSLVLIAGSSAALLEEFKVAHDDNIKAQSDLKIAQAAAVGLNVPQLTTVSTFFTLLAELGAAKAEVATAGAHLSDEVVKAAKAVKDKAIDFGKTTDAATTDADKFTEAMRLTNLSAQALRDVMDVTGLSPAAIVAILGSSSTGLGGIAVAGGVSITNFASAAAAAGLSIGGFKELLDKNGLTATSFDALKAITGQTTTTLAGNLALAATSTDKLAGSFDSIKGAFTAFNTILAAVAPPDFTSAINLVFDAYGLRLSTSQMPDFSPVASSVSGFTNALGGVASAATAMAQLLASYKLPTGAVAGTGGSGAVKSTNQLLVEDWYRTNVNAIKTTDVQGIAYWIAEIERVGILATKIAFSNEVARTTGTAPIPIANFSAPPPPQTQQTNNALLAEVKAMKDEIIAMRTEQTAGDLANVTATTKTTKLLNAVVAGELSLTTTTET